MTAQDEKKEETTPKSGTDGATPVKTEHDTEPEDHRKAPWFRNRRPRLHRFDVV